MIPNVQPSYGPSLSFSTTPARIDTYGDMQPRLLTIGDNDGHARHLKFAHAAGSFIAKNYKRPTERERNGGPSCEARVLRRLLSFSLVWAPPRPGSSMSSFIHTAQGTAQSAIRT